MSLSILNNLLELDKQNMWLKYIDDNGYLACIINSVQANNSLLEECFHSEMSDRKIIYVYETKMVKQSSNLTSYKNFSVLFFTVTFNCNFKNTTRSWLFTKE